MKKLLCTAALLMGMFLPLHDSSAEQIAIPKPDMSYAAEQGPDFAAAYKLFVEAPTKSYDYGPAIEAFRKLAESPSLSEAVRRDACFLLCLAEFSGLEFQDAAKDSGRLFDMLRQGRQTQEEPDRRLAKQIVEMCSAGQVENIVQLREIIYAGSRFKVLLPGDEADALMGAAQAEGSAGVRRPAGENEGVQDLRHRGREARQGQAVGRQIRAHRQAYRKEHVADSAGAEARISTRPSACWPWKAAGSPESFPI